jgi:hypothetical protein
MSASNFVAKWRSNSRRQDYKSLPTAKPCHRLQIDSLTAALGELHSPRPPPISLAPAVCAGAQLFRCRWPFALARGLSAAAGFLRWRAVFSLPLAFALTHRLSVFHSIREFFFFRKRIFV